jgi:hypothetical protein
MRLVAVQQPLIGRKLSSHSSTGQPVETKQSQSLSQVQTIINLSSRKSIETEPLIPTAPLRAPSRLSHLVVDDIVRLAKRQVAFASTKYGREFGNWASLKSTSRLNLRYLVAPGERRKAAR